MTAETDSQSICALVREALAPDIERAVRLRTQDHSTVWAVDQLGPSSWQVRQGRLLPEGEARGRVLAVVDQFVGCMSGREYTDFVRKGTLPAWFLPACTNAWTRAAWGAEDDWDAPPAQGIVGER